MPQPDPKDKRSTDLPSPGVSRLRARRVRVAVYVLPVALAGLYLVLDLLGGGCSGDLLDNADYTCNTGGAAMWVIFFLGPVAVAVAAATLLTALAAPLVRGSGRGRR